MSSMRRWIYKSMTDEALLASYAKGKTEAFECLYMRHKTKLFAFLNRQCHDAGTSEELAHDTWLAVINQAATFKAEAKFTTWVFRIAHNRLIDYWRKHGSTSSKLLEEVKAYHLVGEDLTSRGLEIDELLAGLKDLPSEQVEVLLLRVEGFSHKEIANITNTKQETVKSRLRYASKSMRSLTELTV